MDVEHLKRLLEKVQRGRVPVAEALDHLKVLPFEQIDCATIDHHRALRLGAPETIFGSGKSPAQVVAIIRRM